MYRHAITKPIPNINWPQNVSTNKIKLFYMQTLQILVENINE